MVKRTVKGPSDFCFNLTGHPSTLRGLGKLAFQRGFPGEVGVGNCRCHGGGSDKSSWSFLLDCLPLESLVLAPGHVGAHGIQDR